MNKTSTTNIRKRTMPRICKTVIIFFFIGMLIGTLVGKLFNPIILPVLKTIYSETISALPSMDIPSDQIVLSSFSRNIKFVMLLFYFSMTDLWRYYCLVFRFIQAFQTDSCFILIFHFTILPE